MKKNTLSTDEINYLFEILRQPNIEGADAELVLSLMRDHSNDVLEYLPKFLEQFPNLAKNIFYFCEHVDDTSSLCDILLEFISQSAHVTEYQLFWIAKLSEERLNKTKKYGDILIKLYEHENATKITKAKILEIPELRYGMRDLREEHLRNGSSD